MTKLSTFHGTNASYVKFCLLSNSTGKTVIGQAGFHGDVLTLTKVIEARLKVREIFA